MSLCTRQVHLDFHTNGTIGDVGADWDPVAFVETLKRGHVNSVTLFARGHHGYVYYMPSEFTVHPSLTFSLLGEQIKACHEAGIRAPIYVTVGWDELAAKEHPEWQIVTPQGVRGENGPLVAGWKRLCLNSPYLDYVWKQTAELFEMFGDEVDGLFFDIIHQPECVCPYCLEAMAGQGLDAGCAQDRLTFAASVEDAYRERFAEAVWAKKADCTLFHNGGHMEARFRPTMDTFSHYELESLPSTGMWGYNHYPICVRYARTWGKPHLGMTGKFHTAWGDFASFKNQAALEFECFQMIANGASCSVGDQLHPRGRLSEPVYDLIGSVYASVEAKEPWCVGAQPQAEIGVLNVESVCTHDGRVDTSNSGALRMLLESQHQFDFIDTQTDWSGYRVVVFPDKVPFDEAMTAKVTAYLSQGGKVIASHQSGLKPDGTGYALDAFGVRYVGQAPHSPDYMLPNENLGANMFDTLHVVYDRGIQVEATDGTIVLADGWAPYFNRAWNHFCSHRQTPPDLAGGPRYPLATINAAGNVIVFTNPLFEGYRRQAPLWYKKVFLAALELLMPDPMLICGAPSSAQTTVTYQPEQKRTIVHLLHYIPERRGLEFDTIEEAIPLYDVTLAVKCQAKPERVYLAPSGDEIAFTYDGTYLHTVVPVVKGHQMVVAE